MAQTSEKLPKFFSFENRFIIHRFCFFGRETNLEILVYQIRIYTSDLAELNYYKSFFFVFFWCVWCRKIVWNGHVVENDATYLEIASWYKLTHKLIDSFKWGRTHEWAICKTQTHSSKISIEYTGSMLLLALSTVSTAAATATTLFQYAYSLHFFLFCLRHDFSSYSILALVIVLVTVAQHASFAYIVLSIYVFVYICVSVCIINTNANYFWSAW